MADPALFSEAGVVQDGAFRTYLVDATLDPATATQIRRGCVLRLTGNLTVNKCDASNRNPIAIASFEWPDPKSSRVLSNYSKSVNIGDTKYDEARVRFITGQKRGEAWCLVEIPANGTDVTITYGNKIVPSNEAGAGVKNHVLDVTSTVNETTVEAALNEMQRVIGTALTNIHTELDAITGLPSLGLNNADTLVKSVSVIKRGWVLVALNIV